MKKSGNLLNDADDLHHQIITIFTIPKPPYNIFSDQNTFSLEGGD
jgi:hypothetical protein